MNRILGTVLLCIVVVAGVVAQTPPAPRELRAELIFSGTTLPAVKLTWHSEHGLWAFRVYRSANDTSHYQPLAMTNGTMYLDHAVMAGTRYYYYVKAVAGNLESPRSNVVNILVTAPTPRPKGIVQGVVTDDSTGLPIPRVFMSFHRVNSMNWNSMGVWTDSLGRYSALLDTGRYILRANPMCSASLPRYRPEYYNNCYEPSCATVIAVAESSVFTANMGLARLTPPVFVHVSGVVTDTANNPLRHARVAIIRTLQEMHYLASLGLTPGIGEEAMTLDGVGHARGVVWRGYTDSLGRYRGRVPGNANYIAMASKPGYLPEYFDNKPTPDLADIIVLGTRDTSGIDFSLAVRPVPNNSISGVVRDSLGTLVPSRIALIPARHPRSHFRYYGHTDSLGAYTITGVEAGKYFVFARPFSGYGPAFYKEGAYGVIRIQDADTVEIVGNVTNINIGVRPISSSGLARVRGTIRTSSTAALAGVRISALSASGALLGIGVTDRVGAYEIDAVAAGTVTIVADREGYRPTETVVTLGATTYTLDNVNMTMTPDGPTSAGGSGSVPDQYALHQNYPNPFNPSTTITFSLPVQSRVTLKVYNMLGQEVASLVHNADHPAGIFDVVWNGTDAVGRAVASGLYFYKLHATAANGGNIFTAVRKMLLLK
ncbi:MAG: hypothetical protein C4326_01860 [Ignavibacteria bacterium]|mgnify:CR=1 FL=1